MIGKSTLGKGFKGLGKYLQSGSTNSSPERVEWLTTRNLPQNISITQAARLMQATANQNTRAQKPLYHLSISWDRNDKVTRLLMEETADKILKELRLTNNQTLILSHQDTQHKHIHIMLNRINPHTLKASSMSNEKRKVQKILRQQELEKNLRKVPGTLYSLDGKYANISQEKELRKLTKDGGLSFKDLAKEVSTPIFTISDTWEALHNNLAEKGLYIQKKGPGLILTDNTNYIKCSSIDRSFSFTNLQKKLGNYENTQRKSGLSSPGLHQGENRHSPKGNSRTDPDHEQRSLGERSEDQRTNQTGTARQRTPQHQQPYKNLFHSLLSKLPWNSSNHERSKQPEHTRNPKSDLLNSNSKYLHKTADTYDYLLTQKEKQETQLKRSFTQIYSDPQKAQETYSKTINELSPKEAGSIINNNPKHYGNLQGISFLGINSPKRQEALDTIPSIPQQINHLHYTQNNLDRRQAEYIKIQEPLRQERQNTIIKEVVTNLGNNPEFLAACHEYNHRMLSANKNPSMSHDNHSLEKQSQTEPRHDSHHNLSSNQEKVNTNTHKEMEITKDVSKGKEMDFDFEK